MTTSDGSDQMEQSICLTCSKGNMNFQLESMFKMIFLFHVIINEPCHSSSVFLLALLHICSSAIDKWTNVHAKMLSSLVFLWSDKEQIIDSIVYSHFCFHSFFSIEKISNKRNVFEHDCLDEYYIRSKSRRRKIRIAFRIMIKWFYLESRMKRERD